MPDSYDRLLAGLPKIELDTDEQKYEKKANKTEKEDLTQKFKQNFLVGKIIG